MCHELHLTAQQPAVETLVQLAQIGAGNRVVLDRPALGEQAVPEVDSLRRIGIVAIAGGVPLLELRQRPAGDLHGRKDAVLRISLVEQTQPLQDRPGVRLVGKHV
jgi:hypothetical protein